MSRFGDDPLFALRDVVLWHCEQRSIFDQLPQRAGPHTGSYVDKRLCDTADGRALLRGMVMAVAA